MKSKYISRKVDEPVLQGTASFLVPPFYSTLDSAVGMDNAVRFNSWAFRGDSSYR